MNECASDDGESIATPTIAACRPSPFANVRRSGASVLQPGHHEPQKLMNTGLPCRRASEKARSSSVVPLMEAAAKVWNPDGGTVTCVTSMRETASCLLSPWAKPPPMAISATSPATSLPLMPPPYRGRCGFRKRAYAARMLIRAAVLWEAGAPLSIEEVELA